MISSTLSWVVKYLITIFSLYTIWKDRVKYKRNFIALISVIVYAFSYLAAKNAYTLFFYTIKILSIHTFNSAVYMPYNHIYTSLF